MYDEEELPAKAARLGISLDEMKVIMGIGRRRKSCRRKSCRKTKSRKTRRRY
jgi:hypothetical protein